MMHTLGIRVCWQHATGHIAAFCRAQINRRCGGEETTALQWASGAGHLAVVDFLLENGIRLYVDLMARLVALDV